ncbi:MAG: hypothetical protein II262_08660 [Alistipes sp.]|nr:hypothetical protein [Alistipes sp.]
MKKIFFIFIITAFSLISCNQSRRIVTEVPIKTEILGIELCKAIHNEDDINDALAEHTNKYFFTTPQKDGNVEVFRSIPIDFGFNYGGLSWTYVDVAVNSNSDVYMVKLVGSYESEETAKQQYESAVAIFSQKYGKGNNVIENNTFWTDNVNSVGISHFKYSALNGSDRNFCELYYTNIELSDKVAAENQPDI